jgi:hypothetical protein
MALTGRLEQALRRTLATNPGGNNHRFASTYSAFAQAFIEVCEAVCDEQQLPLSLRTMICLRTDFGLIRLQAGV